MANWGSVATTTENTDDKTRFGGGPFGASAGTLTDVKLFLGGWAGSGETFRVGVYQGGTSTDPTGAPLIYDSGQIDGSALTGTMAWKSLVTDYGLSPSGSLAASTPTWIVVKLAADCRIGQNSTDKGDLTYLSGGTSYNASAYFDLDPSVPMLATFPTFVANVPAEQIMAQLVFTVGGGSGSANLVMKVFGSNNTVYVKEIIETVGSHKLYSNGTYATTQFIESNDAIVKQYSNGTFQAVRFIEGL